MKKNLLFMVINMNVGGTEKALLNMIELIPKEGNNITILLLEKTGGFLKHIPEWVQVKHLQEYQNIKSIINDPPFKILVDHIKSLKFFKAFILFFLYLISRVRRDRTILFKYLLREYSPKDEYDIAVAYAGPMDFISFFVAYKVNAKRRIQWIHFDITKIGFNKHFAAKIYNMFDKIYVVSEEGRKKLSQELPLLKNKMETFINVVPKLKIKEKADLDEGFHDSFNGIRILTVGRLSKEKGQDLTIPALAKLKKDGFNIRWYCIGEGIARGEYETLIKKHGVEKDFILLGSNPNPYPFIKSCDIYVQPSRHEGYCITLAEAKCFNKPIVCTDFTGANEQVTQGQTGLIVEADYDQIYIGVKKLISEKNLQRIFIENLQAEADSTLVERLKSIDI